MRYLRLLYGLSAIMLALIIIPSMSAQGGPIAYGSTLTVEISAAAPQSLFTFTGQAGELVTVYAIGNTAGLQPTLTLLGPTGQLGFNNGDRLSPVSGDARITYRLQQPGQYNIVVGSMNNAMGTYTITLQSQPAAIATPLGPEGATAIFQPGSPPALYAITSQGTSLDVSFLGQPADFAYTVGLRAPDGTVLAALDNIQSDTTLGVPAVIGIYELVVAPVDPLSTGQVLIFFDSCTATTTTQSVPTPAITQVYDPPPTNICAAIAGYSGTNIRSGPGLQDPIVGTLNPGQYIQIYGRIGDWYLVQYNGQNAYIAVSAVTTSGPCAELPPVNYTPTPYYPDGTPVARYTSTPYYMDGTPFIDGTPYYPNGTPYYTSTPYYMDGTPFIDGTPYYPYGTPTLEGIVGTPVTSTTPDYTPTPTPQ